jgi:hypothetical protein
MTNSPSWRKGRLAKSGAGALMALGLMWVGALPATASSVSPAAISPASLAPASSLHGRIPHNGIATSPTFGGYKVSKKHFPVKPPITADATFIVPTVNCTLAETAAGDALILGGGAADKFGTIDGIFQEVICTGAGVEAYPVDATFAGVDTDLGSVSAQPGDIIQIAVRTSGSRGSATLTDVSNGKSLSATGGGIKVRAVDIGNDYGSIPQFSGITFTSTTIDGTGLQSLKKLLYEEQTVSGAGIVTSKVTSNSFMLGYVP